MASVVFCAIRNAGLKSGLQRLYRTCRPGFSPGIAR
jgi:hypothetical protein